MKVAFKESILYNDCELLFEAEDETGRRYIAVLDDDYQTGCEYIMAPATHEDMAAFKAGRMGLRDLLLASPGGEWYATEPGGDADGIPVVRQPTPITDHPDLLDGDYYVPIINSGQAQPEDAKQSPPSADASPHNADAPRLIEKWLPINQISTEAIRERAGAVPNPAPHQLHVWWARRPLAPSRASTLLSLIPQSADDEDTRHSVLNMLGTSQDIHRTALRLAASRERGERDKDGYGDHRRAFTHNPTTEQLDWLRANLPNANPVVLDVTAGGGSIPFEAGRLGFRTIANELNPVASHILRATCEWPQRYGYPLLDEYGRKLSLTEAWSGIAGRYLARVTELLEDVYPEETEPDWMVRWNEKYHDDIQKNRIVRANRYAQTYLFARTISCPSCQLEIPLSPNWKLDDRGTGIRVIPEPNAGRCSFEIVKSAAKQSTGTVNGAIATCPHCGTTTPKGYIAAEAQQGRLGHQLYCVILNDQWQGFTKAGQPKKRLTTQRSFRTAAPADDASIRMSECRLKELTSAWDDGDILPTEAVPIGNDQRPHTYGMEQWVKMFSPRQQLAHGYCVQAFRECVDADVNAGRLDERRRAAWSYVAIAIDKMINRNSLLTRWDGGANKVASTFDSHDFGMKWSYSEMIVGGPHGYGLRWAIDDIRNCLSEMLAMAGHPEPIAETIQAEMPGKHEVPTTIAPPTRVIRGDARDLPLEDASVDCVVFDPPYEENVCYAELSDFFYVWLKRTAGYVFPDDFTDYLTEKDQEAIASPARFKGRATKGRSAKTLALADYQEKMAEIFTECRRVIKDDGIATVMFNHKSTAAWDALTVGLIEAGFSITRTWPVKTEAESSIHIKGKAAARTTILLVCRPREENPFPKPWHEVEELIAQAVRDDIQDNLGQADLRPIDLYLSAFGPALRVISEHWGTERESNNPERTEDPFLVTPTDALQVARREVSRHRALEISREWANNPMDAATKFYVLAKDATENDTLLFDEANLLARAIGVRLEKNDADMKGIVGFKADKVSLLSARDRLAARDIGEDVNPGSTLDTVHTAIALTDRRNTLDAQQWLAQHLHDPQEGQFRATLEALIRTTKPGHDDYQAQRNLWQALYGEEAPRPAVAQQGALL